MIESVAPEENSDTIQADTEARPRNSLGTLYPCSARGCNHAISNKETRLRSHIRRHIQLSVATEHYIPIEKSKFSSLDMPRQVIEYVDLVDGSEISPRRDKDHGSERVYCTCTAESGCEESCANRSMAYECHDSNCKVGDQCGNRSFEDLERRKDEHGLERVDAGVCGYSWEEG